MSTKSKLALVSATVVTLFTSSAFAQTVNSPATNKEDVFRWAAAAAGLPSASRHSEARWRKVVPPPPPSRASPATPAPRLGFRRR